jgi:hypothetical protein
LLTYPRCKSSFALSPRFFGLSDIIEIGDESSGVEACVAVWNTCGYHTRTVSQEAAVEDSERGGMEAFAERLLNKG